jgi:hypothetical protein
LAHRIEPAKTLAMQILSNQGFHVEEIPVGDARSADLAIRDGDSSSYHVEVKEKIDTPSVAQEREDCLARGDVYQQSDLLAHDNRISAILRDAEKQLDATAQHGDAYRLVWFHASGIDADLKARQAFATFYGQVQLFALEPRQSEIATCYYFDYSAAFAMRTVEALIISDHRGFQVCLNEFSHRANEFRTTPLCKTFCELGCVCDPRSLASEGKIIACRFCIPRKSDDDICSALREQTGVLYKPIRLNRYSASAAVRTPED